MIKQSILALFLFLTIPLSAQTQFQPTMTVGGYVQVQALYDESESAVDDFLIKRARIGAKGTVTDNVTYSFSMGATESPDSEPHLVNAYIDLNYLPNTIIRVGQALVPFGLEGSQSVPTNPDIDRATTTKLLNTFAMYRDRGIQLRGQYGNVFVGAAVVNGSGANSRDDSGTKDLLGQVRVTVLPQLKLGVSGHSGSVVDADVTLSRRRLGLDAEWSQPGTKLRAEYITLSADESVDSEITSTGWYVLGLKDIAPLWQAFVRVEQHTPDISGSDNQLSITTIGTHYRLTGKSRISASYALQDDEADSTLKNKLTTQIQIVF